MYPTDTSSDRARDCTRRCGSHCRIGLQSDKGSWAWNSRECIGRWSWDRSTGPGNRRRRARSRTCAWRCCRRCRWGMDTSDPCTLPRTLRRSCRSIDRTHRSSCTDGSTYEWSRRTPPSLGIDTGDRRTRRRTYRWWCHRNIGPPRRSRRRSLRSRIGGSSRRSPRLRDKDSTSHIQRRTRRSSKDRSSCPASSRDRCSQRSGRCCCRRCRSVQPRTDSSGSCIRARTRSLRASSTCLHRSSKGCNSRRRYSTPDRTPRPRGMASSRCRPFCTSHPPDRSSPRPDSSSG